MCVWIPGNYFRRFKDQGQFLVLPGVNGNHFPEILCATWLHALLLGFDIWKASLGISEEWSRCKKAKTLKLISYMRLIITCDSTFTQKGILVFSSPLLTPIRLGDACRPEEIIDNWVDMRENVLKPKLRKLYQKKLPYLQFVNPFMAMECALSRVIESLLLLDRYAFLDEQGSLKYCCISDPWR